MIEFNRVSYRYPAGESLALDSVSLSIQPGEFVLIGGLSGSGKSTLLRSINGLIPHLSGGEFGGSVRTGLDDTRRNGPRVLSRSCGFVFQDPDAQAVAETVEEEIAFSLEQFGVPRSTMRVRIEEMLNLLGIAHLRSRLVTSLSGGERQRVAIAGALALHPSRLVLDEPTSQLDPWGADDVLDALVRLNHHLGITVVVAEHRLERFLPVADRVVWMDQGRVAIDGTPEEAVRVLPEMVLPPVIAMARKLEIWPVPLTIKEARRSLGWRPDTSPARKPPIDRRLALSVTNATIRRNGRSVISNIALDVAFGEVVSLVGPNGAGKTTLLRTLFGFEQPERGNVTVLGCDMRTTSASALGKRAAYLPQRSGSVLFNESVRAELEFTSRHRESNRDAGKLVDWLNLRDLLDSDPRDLSEGQRLRAALAAILIGDPELVLLDEPTRGLDGEMRRRMVDLIRSLRARGVCVLIATHDTELAAELSDRVVLLGNGSVVSDDSAEVVLGNSLAYSTQIARLFGPPYLTLSDTGLFPATELLDTSAGAER